MPPTHRPADFADALEPPPIRPATVGIRWGVVILKPRRDQRTHPRERFPHNDISRHSPPTGHRPARHRTHPRRGTTPGRPAAPVCRRCYTPVGRQLYYSTAPAARPRSAAGTSNPARRWPPGPAGKITVYECPDCGDRYLGEQRCESCGTFARRVGIGGACPNCDGPVAISDLLDQAVVTIAKK